MTPARWLVRLAARLVPLEVRSRWREEWLAEIDASGAGALRRALGAPRDALLTRWTMKDPGEWARATWRVDIRDAWRALLRTPVQSLTIFACLTIGSTLTVLMFGVVNTMLDGSLPGVRDRDRLVTWGVVRNRDSGRRGALTMGEFRRLPDAVPGFDSFGGELSWRFSATVNGRALFADGRFVTGGYFRTLGTYATAGRLIGPEDDRSGAAAVAVVSESFWRRHFDADSSRLGTAIRVGTGTYQIVGVLPRGFVGLDGGDPGELSDERGEIWLPMREMWSYAGYGAAQVDRAVGPRMIGRLEDGLSTEQAGERAQAALSAVAGSGVTPRFAPFTLGADADEAPLLVATLMFVPFAVLAIACANVAGVQLARAVARTHEIAIKVSLGASRRRVVRGLAIETGIVAAAAAAVAWIASTRVLSLSEHVLPFAVNADVNVFVFSALLPMGITLVAGLVPAWRATGFDVLSGLRLGPRAGRSASRRLRQCVVAAQVAMSVLLLMSAGYLIRSAQLLPNAIGPLRTDIVVANIGFFDLGLEPDRIREIRTSLTERVAALPGVTSSAVANAALTGGPGLCWTGSSPTATTNDMLRGGVHLAAGTSATYFSTVDARFLQGRAFRAGERRGVVVINDAFAAELRRSGDALGATIRIQPSWNSPSELATVVGIVADSYERAPRGTPKARCYVPLADDWASSFTIFARTGNAPIVIEETRRSLASIDRRLSPASIGTIEDLLWEQYRSLRGVAGALAAASAMALLLAAVGLFGVMAHGASERSHEFGVRMALGAPSTSITSHVLRESLAITMTGAAIGFVASIPLAVIFKDAILSTISWHDPVPPAIVVGVLVCVGVVATLLPAMRIARIDPVRALRQE
jgi:predicted permease